MSHATFSVQRMDSTESVWGKPERRRVAYSLGIQHNYRGFAKASAERKITARVSLAFNVPIKIATGNLALLG